MKMRTVLELSHIGAKPLRAKPSQVQNCKLPSLVTAAGLYKRNLPSPPATDFASPEGKVLFREALVDGTMEGFYKLISYFQTQSEPSYCGLASLAMVLNALAIDPCRKWKGPWRWFDESMLDCCEPLEKIKVTGISFGKVVCLAHCAGANVEAFRTNQSSLDEFRNYVIACSASDSCHMITSYHRGTFKQTGSGHFSPIGGYHAKSDMALILDVARFKYPPHWVPLSLLWEAMDTIDQSTGLRRGFMLVSRRHEGPAVLHFLSCKHECWTATAKFLTGDLPVLLSSDNWKGVNDVLSAVISSLPPGFSEFTTWLAEISRKDDNGQSPSQEENQRLARKEEMLRQVRRTGLHKHVRDTLPSENSFREIKRTLARNDVLTLLLLALPPQTWLCIKDGEVLQQILTLVSVENIPPLPHTEISYLRCQLLLYKRCNDCWVEDAPLI